MEGFSVCHSLPSLSLLVRLDIPCWLLDIEKERESGSVYPRKVAKNPIIKINPMVMKNLQSSHCADTGRRFPLTPRRLAPNARVLRNNVKRSYLLSIDFIF